MSKGLDSKIILPMNQLKPTPDIVEYEKIQKQLSKLFVTAGLTKERKSKIARVRIDYAQEHRRLLIKYMKKEIEIYKDKSLDLVI